jgi:hypothetical protein
MTLSSLSQANKQQHSFCLQTPDPEGHHQKQITCKGLRGSWKPGMQGGATVTQQRAWATRHNTTVTAGTPQRQQTLSSHLPP